MIMIATILLAFEPLMELPAWLVITLFGVPFVGGISLYIYKTRHARSWRKGVFPQTLKPNEDNFLEAYLALGAKLILLDYQNSKGKTQFINEYFNRYFRFSNYNFSDSLLFSLRYPIQTETVTNWMKEHLESESARSQVIYFLTGLVLVNGTMNHRELELLRKINSELGLPSENLAQIIAIYASYYQRKEDSTQSKTQKSHDKSYAYEILGLKKNADQEAIKKAYRTMVKLHHPDVFAGSSESQQKMAAEKFIEIQNAYEELRIS